VALRCTPDPCITFKELCVCVYRCVCWLVQAPLGLLVSVCVCVYTLVTTRLCLSTQHSEYLKADECITSIFGGIFSLLG